MGLRIGDDGHAIATMTPSGHVSVGGKRYHARAQAGFIESGQRVIVLGGDNNGLIVCIAEDGKSYASLMNFGQPCYSSFGERVQAKADREEAARQRWQVNRRRYIRKVGLGLGSLSSCFGLLWAWTDLVQRLGGPGTLAASIATTVVGALLGMAMLGTIDHYLRAFSEDFYRLSIPTTSLALLGGTAGAVRAIPAYGLAVGLLTALTIGFLLLLPVPALALFAGSFGGDAVPSDGNEAGMVEANREGP